MNTARNIESDSHPQLHHQSDRVAAINLTMQQVEREHASRVRRMAILLGGAAALLIINGIVITALS